MAGKNNSNGFFFFFSFLFQFNSKTNSTQMTHQKKERQDKIMRDRKRIRSHDEEESQVIDGELVQGVLVIADCGLEHQLLLLLQLQDSGLD